MIEFLTLISLLCARSAPGHGATMDRHARLLSAQIREDAFNEQSACIRRLHRECTRPHAITKVPVLVTNAEACLIEKL